MDHLMHDEDLQVLIQVEVLRQHLLPRLQQATAGDELHGQFLREMLIGELTVWGQLSKSRHELRCWLGSPLMA